MERAEGTWSGRRGVDLYYQSWSLTGSGGGGAAVVYVHGIGDHGSRHPHLVEALVLAGHMVLTPDLRGHGRSPGRRGHIDAWADYREDLHGLVQVARSMCPGSPLFLVGHSLGGLIVLEYALRLPEGLRGVVAMSPALNLDGVPRWKVVASIALGRLVPRLSMRLGLDSEGLSRDPAVKSADDQDPLLHSRATVRLGAEVPKALGWTLEHAGELRVPLLVVHGSADTIVPAAASLAFYERAGVPDKTRIEYEGGYHELDNDTEKDRVLRDMRDWLADRM